MKPGLFVVSSSVGFSVSGSFVVVGFVVVGLVVVGLCCIMQKVEVDQDTIKRDIPYSLLAAVLLIGLGMTGRMELGRLDGVILLAFFAFFFTNHIKAQVFDRRGDDFHRGFDHLPSNHPMFQIDCHALSTGELV